MIAPDSAREKMRQELEELVREAMKAEMDAMWEHIRNLEKKLLNPTEYEIYY